ncbi:hypothetical protein SAMN05192529_13124 [Arachidicoccus rhizosphaerae]|uniref:Phage protein, HK97 gp10 family n=1 Tax=Arachidicoccus rhizosphaerae TaxID=551991 RepID=A0A1H4CFC7_9BACT|nr:hypothetical protein [Arachidicoccus rhizosphaerae]SEA59087.1 hypothetical protein SAMN05192529_13124 [Arachidicoccus rhizosphaerae]
MAQLKGFDTVMRALQEKQNRIKAVTDQVMKESSQEILTRAKGKCQFPEVRRELTLQYIDGKWIVSTQTPESAYVEFGTGLFAKRYVPGLPGSWQQMAWNFYINGKGRTPSFPYLYPAYEEVTAHVMDTLAEAIEGT